jgi:hypothetical protein
MDFSEFPTEMFLEIFSSTTETMAIAFELNHVFHDHVRDEILDRLPPSVQSRLDDIDPMLQNDICDLLLLQADKVRRYPHISRRRRGGGEYHLYDIDTVKQILSDEGGARAYHARVAAKKKRSAAKRKRDSTTEAELDAGLNALGLVRRADSTMCYEYIAAPGKKHKLRDVLVKMAHMHFLHEHTDGTYKAALKSTVRVMGEIEGYFRGIHNVCGLAIQNEPRFQLPATLPWLPGDTATEEAIDKAVATALCARMAADPVASGKRQKATELVARRKAALAARLGAFAEARMQKESIKTAMELHARAQGTTTFDFGNFFDEVLKPTVGVKALLDLALRLES